MNPLDELRRLATPERFWADPQADGRGVRVAVVDTGIDQATLRARHPHVAPVQGGVFTAFDPRPSPYEGTQSSPHGTTVADIVASLAPGVELFSADVFGPAGTCETDVVLKALAWAVDKWQCRVVNLSLGVTEQKLTSLPKRQQFLRAIEDAYFKDVVVVAAAHNDHPWTKSYPALFAPPLVSVNKRATSDAGDFGYRLWEQVEFEAHARGSIGPFAREPATSWAAPHVSAMAARLLSLRPDLKPFEVKTLLYWLGRA